jgi:pimeloyl-ACP methyl ester carboxylesterase
MSSLSYAIENGVSLWRGGPVDDRGAPPLLFLHAGGTGADIVRRLAEPFATYRQVIAPDFPGYGQTPAAPDQDAIAARVALVQAMLQSHDGPVDIVGHSMGAFMALQASLHWPEKIGRLAAIEPVAFGAIATGDPADQAALAIDQDANRALVEAYDRGEREQGIAAFISLWNGTPWAHLPAPVRTGLLKLGPVIRREADAVSSDRTPASAYAHLGGRLCLIAGETSPAPALRIVRRLHEAAAGSRLVTIAGAGHMGPIMQPKLYWPVLMEFLKCGAHGDE